MEPATSVMGTTTSYLGELMGIQYGYDGSTRTVGTAGKRPNETIKPKKSNRRGWGKKLKRKKFNCSTNQKMFSIFGTNANGLKGKIESLKNNIEHFKPSCINIQESKLDFLAQSS